MSIELSAKSITSVQKAKYSRKGSRSFIKCPFALDKKTSASEFSLLVLARKILSLKLAVWFQPTPKLILLTFKSLLGFDKTIPIFSVCEFICQSLSLTSLKSDVTIFLPNELVYVNSLNWYIPKPAGL